MAKKPKPVHKQIKNTARGTKTMKASKKRPLVFSTTLRKLVRAQYLPNRSKDMSGDMLHPLSLLYISTNKTPVEMNKGGKSSQQRTPSGIPLEIRRVSKVRILTVCERVSTI